MIDVIRDAFAWIGFPASLAFVLFVWKKIKGIILGVQAMLRAQMISEYNKAKDKGYAPIYAKQNFQNMWNNYHSLGVNGVMDHIKDEYLTLPDRKEDENEKN